MPWSYVPLVHSYRRTDQVNGECTGTGNGRAMTGEGDTLRSIATRNLQALGLSEYAARTLLALTRIGSGSARDVSDASSVPRTRVYDAVDELADRGFVRVHECHPKEFTPSSPERIRRAFYREFVFRQAIAEWGLRALEPADDRSERGGVDVEMGIEAVDRRFLDAIADAEERLTYVSIQQMPREQVVAALDDAVARDVRVRVLSVDGELESLRDAIPGATVLTASEASTPNGPSRFLLVDESLALLGVQDTGSGDRMEVGFFSDHAEGGLITLLQQVIDSWLVDLAEA